MKKYLIMLTAFLSFFLVVSPASAQEFAIVSVSSFDTGNISNEIYLDKGETLHLNLWATSGTATYRVTDRFDNVMTSGTVTPSTPKTYPKGAAEGFYKLILKCSNDSCKASGRISDY
ncbi:hypothetical protein AF332_07885 [Sporosarcina globispora]|uniref:Uncharacterized protein n=1 Tax=Sporosarcina globispora TaxID=1459 RepID=A0A0M0GB15_SPOGL|nr:hypothetical protein [Sporosarcina globispora]KON86722.1 hypothetical protein AF332_07885 [Sporosarcina globispora]